MSNNQKNNLPIQEEIINILFKNNNNNKFTVKYLNSGAFSSAYKLTINNNNYTIKFSKCNENNCTISDKNNCESKNCLNVYMDSLPYENIFNSHITLNAFICYLYIDYFKYKKINYIIPKINSSEKRINYNNNIYLHNITTNITNCLKNDNNCLPVKNFINKMNENKDKYSIMINTFVDTPIISNKIVNDKIIINSIFNDDNNKILLFLIDMMIMLYYIKKQGINHTDIKNDNIMFSSNLDKLDNRECFKLIDFSKNGYTSNYHLYYEKDKYYNNKNKEIYDYYFFNC